MGDNTTHAIFHSAYWHLVYRDGGFWFDTGDGSRVCAIGREDRLVDLRDEATT